MIKPIKLGCQALPCTATKGHTLTFRMDLLIGLLIAPALQTAGRTSSLFVDGFVADTSARGRTMFDKMTAI